MPVKAKPTAAGLTGKRVDAYGAGLPAEQAQIVTALRRLVRQAAPTACCRARASGCGTSSWALSKTSARRP